MVNTNAFILCAQQSHQMRATSITVNIIIAEPLRIHARMYINTHAHFANEETEKNHTHTPEIIYYLRTFYICD